MGYIVLFIIGIIVIGWISATLLPVLAGVVVFSISVVIMALLLSPLMLSYKIGKYNGRKSKK